MILEITWTPQSIDSYVLIVKRIREKWTQKEEDNFRADVDRVLFHIARTPEMFPSAKKKNIRKRVLSKLTSLYYIIQKHHVELLLFWDNRNDPRKLKC